MAEIRWTEEALRWLQDIRDYIALDNPAAAYEVVSGIFEKPSYFEVFPRSVINTIPKPRVISESCSTGITGSRISCIGLPISTSWVFSMARSI